MGNVAASPLPPRGSPPLHSGGQNQNWPIHGQGGYITPAASGIPTASKRGAKSEVAHIWARWLHNPCRRGDPHRFRAGGQNQKWTINGQGGYITLAASGIPHRFRAGGKIRSGPQVGKVATSPLPPRGSPPLQSGRQNPHQGGYITPAASGIPTASSGGQNQKWPINGQGGYITLAASGFPTASQRGAKSEVAHKWASKLHHPCRLGVPDRFTAGGKIQSGAQMGKVATSPLPRGDPHRFTAGGRIRIGP